MILTEILKTNAERHPSKAAFTMRMGYRSVSLTYKEVYDMAQRVACLLSEEGVKKGDAILVLAPNSPYWIALFWGALLRGAVIVPLNTQMTNDTVQRIADETRAKVFFKNLHSMHELKGGFAARTIEFLEEDTRRFNVSCFEKTNLDENDVVEILYTSGTTGDPKGVVLTHKNLSANLETLAPLTKLSQGDRFLSVLPLSHIFEQMVGFLLPFYNAAHVIYAHSPAAISGLLKEYRITKMVAVPEFLSVMLSRIKTEVRERGATARFMVLVKIAHALRLAPIQRLLFSSVHRRLGGALKVVACGGAALDTELEKTWNALGVRILQGYGLTETSPIITLNTEHARRIGSVGKVLPGVEIKIAPDGEILAKGPSVFSGYFKDVGKTEAAFTEDGFFNTGDIGEVDADGFLFIRGRKKYLIKGPGAQNVYPEDIERALNAVHGVRDSSVIGITKQSGALEIHAVILGDAENLPSVVAEANKNLASYQRITGWSRWPHDDFPRSATRKIKREEVIKWLSSRREMETAPVAGAETTPIMRLLADVTGMDATSIYPDTKIVADLNLDSLLRVELAARIEEEFGVVIDEPRIDTHTTVDNLERLVALGKPLAERTRFKTWPLSVAASLARSINQSSWIFPLVRLFASVRVEGIENIKKLPLPAVFMPTHASHFDSVVLLAALPRRIRRRVAYAAARDVVYETYRYWSLLAELFFNAFPFPRKEGEDIRGGLEHMGRVLDRGWSVVVYPEGQMSETGDMLPLKTGAGLVAVEMDVPVVPVKIVGSRDIVPYAKFIPRRRGTVTITFGKPLRFNKKDSYADATQKIERHLRAL